VNGYIPESSVLRGLTVSSAQKFGMPNVGAFYTGRGVHTNRLEEGATCAICGAMATNSHHEPQLGMGCRNASFRLHGRVLTPALIALCGSGSTGCHGRVHSGSYRIEWEWDDPETEAAWFDGRMPEEAYRHDKRMFWFGHWAVYAGGVLIKEIKEEQ
jgi:hypothetical protein